MAGVNLSSVILKDNWPGIPNPNLGIPKDGWDNTKDNFKTTSAADLPTYPLGTKIMAYTDNSWCPGWYTMMYLVYHSYESGALYDISQDFSDGFPGCAHADGSTAAHYCTLAEVSTIPYYVVTKCITTDGGDVDYTRSNCAVAAIAVPCATLSSDGTACFTQGGYGDSFGWFWVGGVCPCKDATIMDNRSSTMSTCTGIGACVTGSFDTRGKGPLYFCVSDAISTGLLTCDPTSIWKLANDISESSSSLQPIGWVCMTAI